MSPICERRRVANAVRSWGHRLCHPSEARPPPKVVALEKVAATVGLLRPRSAGCRSLPGGSRLGSRRGGWQFGPALPHAPRPTTATRHLDQTRVDLTRPSLTPSLYASQAPRLPRGRAPAAFDLPCCRKPRARTIPRAPYRPGLAQRRRTNGRFGLSLAASLVTDPQTSVTLQV